MKYLPLHYSVSEKLNTSVKPNMHSKILLNSSLILVLPYMTAEFRNNDSSFLEYYDKAKVSQTASSGHFKAAIQTRNKEMVDRLILLYLMWTTHLAEHIRLTYAQKKEVAYINISNHLKES